MEGPGGAEARGRRLGGGPGSVHAEVLGPTSRGIPELLRRGHGQAWIKVVGAPQRFAWELSAPSLSLPALLPDSSSTASHGEGFTNTHPRRQLLCVPRVLCFHIS